MRGRGRCVCGLLAGLVIATTLHARSSPSAYAADPQVKIDVMSLFVAEPGADTQIIIRVTPQDALPKNAYVRIRGLPATVTLSDGYAVTPGVWSVPMNGLSTLKVVVPKGVSGRSELALSVLTVDGQILAEARSALLVAQVNLRAQSAEPPKVATVEPTPVPQATLVPSVPRAERPTPERLPTERPPSERSIKAEIVPSLSAPTGAAPIPAPKPAPADVAMPTPEPPKSEPKSQVVIVSPPPAPPVVALPKVTPPAMSPPVVTGDTRQRNERMIEQGDKALTQGNVSTARQFYLRAADGGSGAAALRLAQSYDPSELAKLRVHGLVGDVAQARAWYEKARDLGESKASERLKALAGN